MLGKKDGARTGRQSLSPYKKTPHASFPSYLLKNVWVESTFPYGLSPRHEKAKRNTIRVVGGTNAKLPHCIGFALVYPMENKIPFVHHVVERWGCNYTDEDNKSISEKTS
jgi:hypothetical protein